MAQWNVSGDQMTIEPKRRRSPSEWLRRNSLKLAVSIGLIEAIVAYVEGVRFLWVLSLLVVFGYWWARSSIPGPLRRPAWIVAMSQLVAGLVVPAIFGAIFIAAAVGVVLLLMLGLVLLGDLRRT